MKFHRVTIASLNDLRQIKHSQTTGIKSITLDKNEEQQLMVMDKELVHPLLISVNLLVVTPNKEIETIESDQLEGLPHTTTSNISNSANDSSSNNCSTSSTTNNNDISTCSRYINNNTNNITSVIRDS